MTPGPEGSGPAPEYWFEEITARLNRLELRLDDIDSFPDEYVTPPAAGGGVGSPTAPGFSTLDSWVEQLFAATFARSLGGEWRWCLRWREHPEAVFRLKALWRAYETLRLDASMGTAVWLRDHLDQQHQVLLSARGPFALCTPTRHEVLAALPLAAGSAER